MQPPQDYTLDTQNTFVFCTLAQHYSRALSARGMQPPHNYTLDTQHTFVLCTLA